MPVGRKAREVWQPLIHAIEKRWQQRFGEDEIAELRESLGAVARQFDLLRTGKEERERLEGELSQLSEPPDPAALIATIEHAKSLGDTDSAVARLKSDVTRLDRMEQSRERENDFASCRSGYPRRSVRSVCTSGSSEPQRILASPGR